MAASFVAVEGSINVALHSYKYWTGAISGKEWLHQTTRTMTASSGTGLGFLAGAKVGASIGIIAGPPGLIIGGIIGGICFGLAGKTVTKMAFDQFSSDNEDYARKKLLEEALLFFGFSASDIANPVVFNVHEVKKHYLWLARRAKDVTALRRVNIYCGVLLGLLGVNENDFENIFQELNDRVRETSDVVTEEKQDIDNVNNDEQKQQNAQKQQDEIEKLKKQMKEMEQKTMEFSNICNFVVIWQWKENDGTWQSYDNCIGDTIEKLNVEEYYKYTFNGNNQTYKITKKSSNSAEQINITSNIKREVKRITKARGMNQVQYPEWWNISGIDLNKQVTAPNPQYAKPHLITLNLNKIPGEDVVSNFRKTMANHKIIKIESVQNQMLYDSYWNARKKLEKLVGPNNLNERDVFHGTGDIDTMSLIYTGGFMKVFNKKAVYGMGTYFARDASYSHGYSGCDSNGVRQMFQCKVLMGESHQGKGAYKLTSWPKKQNGLIYDSLVDIVNNPSIFVIHENVRAYPMFIIHFK
eukprot:148486_1